MQFKNSLFIALGASLFVGVCALWFYQAHSSNQQEALRAKQEQLGQSLKVAEGFLNRSHPLRALEILREEEPAVAQSPNYKYQWAILVLRAAKDLGDDRLLDVIYTSFPELIKQNEDLSYRLSVRFLVKGDKINYEILKQTWAPVSQKPNQWLLLESDALALNGEADKALQLLKSRPLMGDDESLRLFKMALLSEKEHPKIAWEYLSQALKQNPSSSDLHYYRAKLLQETPHHNLAPFELKHAIENDPSDPLYREDLAEYYFSHHQYSQAHDLLQSSLAPPSTDKIWLEALFLSKTFKPISFTQAYTVQPRGELMPFVRYLLSLPQNQAWNTSLLKNQLSIQEIAKNIPEGEWLEVLGTLQEGSDIEAFKILASHPEMANIHPELYNSLQKAIAYKYPHLSLEPHFAKNLEPSKPTHPIFKQIFESSYPKDLENLLTSNESYAALFLAAGWYEASLSLHKMGKIPTDFPRWVSYGFTKAYENNRGIESALQFAEKQPPTAQLSFLIGELSLKTGKNEEAISQLTPLVSQNTELGSKATALLTNLYIQEQNFEKASVTALGNNIYANSLEGKEKLAFIQLKMGHVDEAEKIYKTIVHKSATAKSFLATQAYQAKNYPLAYSLTSQLIKEYPEQKDLKARLALISEAIKSDKK